VPYFAHPVLVALGVFKYSQDENVLAVAILHDVMEDCDVTYTELKELFGSKVANIVKEVSSPTNIPVKNRSWKDRKVSYMRQIKNISKEACIIVAVDKMTNMQAYFGATEANNKKSLGKFGGTLTDYFWYYGEIYNILKSNLGNHPVIKEYEKLLKNHEKNLQKD